MLLKSFSKALKIQKIMLTRCWEWHSFQQNDVIMGAMVHQITSLTIVYSTVYSGAEQRKHQSSVSLALCEENPSHRANNAELFINISFVTSLNNLLNKESMCRWFVFCLFQTVHVDIPEEDVTYVHRGCLPSCRNNEEYPVMNYGTGTIECCVGDLCNLATHVTLSGVVIVTTTLLAVVHVLLWK